MMRKSEEITSISEDGATAFSGTGFNEDNPQHCNGSDAVRLAIWIQMARDRKEFEEADRLRASLWPWFICRQSETSTTVQARSGHTSEGAKMILLDGILYDQPTPEQRDHLARLASHAAGVAAERIKARLEDENPPRLAPRDPVVTGLE